MDFHQATSVFISKIKRLEPEYATKITGFLLMQDLTDNDLIRLAFGPDNVLHSVVLKAKSDLGLLANTSLSAPPISPISRPSVPPPPPLFPQSSPRVPVNHSGFGFPRPPSSPSGNSSTYSGFPNNSISPKSSPLLSYDNIRAALVPASPFSRQSNGNTGNTSRNGSEHLDESQLSEYLSFLNDSSKNEDLVEPRLELGYGSNAHLHKRSFSASDVCLGSEDAVFGTGFGPCLYFSKGFCRNGNNCKFVHNDCIDGFDGPNPIAGSPSKFDGFKQHENMMSLKAAQQHRLALASQFMRGASPSPYNKQMNFLLQQKNDPQRSAAIAMIVEEETQKLRRIQTERWHTERNDFFAMGLGEKGNSASRQIYLTFPADSTFKDEDVSDYFSNFGQVQDVRIPYQQKRMFGFVTFVYPETVKHILNRGNPHFICDSRVLVKPYKEKGKVADSCRRQQHQLQQEIERGDYGGCLSPSSLDPRECFDLHAVPSGPRSLYNAQEMMLRRKLEEQAELQHAIELQGRRLMNLQLPNMNSDRIHHHQRSLSVGPFVSMPTDPLAYLNQNVTHLSDNFNQEVAQDSGDIPKVNGGDNSKEDSFGSIECDPHESLERFLPDCLFASPTKSSPNHSSAFSTSLAESKEITGITRSSSFDNNPLLPTTSTSDSASF